MQSHLSQERRYASPSLRGQQGPDRRRQIAHRGIQANAPGRIALQTRFSVIRPVSSIYQRYREWDIENVFDEMKNQWGWGGFTTHDLARCRLAARLLALFYNWWNIFVRLADPSLHREAITSRPLFLAAIAARTRHARQTTIRVTSSHAKAEPAARALAAVAAFLRGLAKNAEQLTRLQKWRAILSRAFQAFLNVFRRAKIGSDSILMKLRRRCGLVSRGNQGHAVFSRLRVAPTRVFARLER